MPYASPTALSVSASSGKANPPCLHEKSSWLATDCGLTASTWAPASVNESMSSVYALSWRVHTGVLSPG